MTNMWTETDSMVKRQEAAGGIWVQLKNDGDKEVLVFVGGPYPREVVFVDAKYEIFNESHKAAGHKSTLRVAINAATYPGKEMKVLEMGVMLYRDLAAMREKRPLDRWAFEVQRHGGPKDPKTRYSLLPEVQLSAEEAAAFASLKQHDLASLYDDAADDGTSIGSYDRAGSGAQAIDPAAAQRLVQALKTLPRSAADEFCAHFGVQRIKDLPASRASEATAYVERLAAPPADIDPFA